MLFRPVSPGRSKPPAVTIASTPSPSNGHLPGCRSPLLWMSSLCLPISYLSEDGFEKVTYRRDLTVWFLKWRMPVP
eukprot:Gb_39189 [translate_table: standard]